MGENDSVVGIVLPFPKNLHAHNSGDWKRKQGAVKRNRAAALGEALKRIEAGVASIVGVHGIGYRFFVPDNRRRDAANMVQQCKPYIDGIVDSGLVEGDHWQVSRIWFVKVEIDKDNPRVEICITSKTRFLR